jgi:hypothetical protein
MLSTWPVGSEHNLQAAILDIVFQNRAITASANFPHLHTAIDQ